MSARIIDIDHETQLRDKTRAMKNQLRLGLVALMRAQGARWYSAADIRQLSRKDSALKHATGELLVRVMTQNTSTFMHKHHTDQHDQAHRLYALWPELGGPPRPAELCHQSGRVTCYATAARAVLKLQTAVQ